MHGQGSSSAITRPTGSNTESADPGDVKLLIWSVPFFVDRSNSIS